MTVHYDAHGVTLYHGDCLDILATLPDASVDAVVTDPPYGLEFMGKEWDKFRVDDPGTGRHRGERAGAHGEIAATNPTNPAAGIVSYGGGKRPSTNRCTGCGKRDQFRNAHDCDPAARWVKVSLDPYAAPPSMLAFQEWARLWAAECLRVLKPGGHLLAFGGTRTWHRLACAIEDAGFEVRDSIAWLYGSGFPKSLDVSKAIDKAAGATRERGRLLRADAPKGHSFAGATYGEGGDARVALYEEPPATPEAARWAGWGTALKPAWESVTVATKPLTDADRIGSHLAALEEACRPPAGDAGQSSAPTRPDSPEARTATAPASAVTTPEGAAAPTTATGPVVDSPAATDTSPSESAATTCWNIATSWSRCWAALSEQTSTSTTSTGSATTIDPTTLWSCLSRITGPSTLLDPTSPDGLSSLARIADDLFAAAALSLNATRALTATEPATSPTPHGSPGAGGSHLQPIVVARKPLAGTVAANVLAHGTGALNVDGCRIGTTGATTKKDQRDGTTATVVAYGNGLNGGGPTPIDAGRWPANVVLDESQAAALDAQSGERPSGIAVTRNGGGRKIFGGLAGNENDGNAVPDGGYTDSGGASRFFYIAKADADERPRVAGAAHPTVKPIALMRWLVRLVTPPGGTVLEPFAGSGTTAEACLLEGFRCIAVEREADYLPLIVARITRQRDPVAHVRLVGDDQPTLFDAEEPA